MTVDFKLCLQRRDDPGRRFRRRCGRDLCRRAAARRRLQLVSDPRAATTPHVARQHMIFQTTCCARENVRMLCTREAQ